MSPSDDSARAPSTSRKTSAARVRAMARVVLALGEQRCVPIMKDDVIAYLIVSDWRPDGREALYREWCNVVGVDISRRDIRRVRHGRKRELNRELFPCQDESS